MNHGGWLSIGGQPPPLNSTAMKKLISVIFLLLLFFFAKDAKAYSVQDITTGETSYSYDYDRYWNFTVSDVADRYLICQLFGSGGSVDFFDYNNVRMTFFGTGSYYGLATFGLVNPRAGTNQFHLKYKSSWGFSQFVCMTVSGINQDDPVGTIAKRDMCSTSPINNSITPEESGSFLFSSLTTQTNARVQSAGQGQVFINELLTSRATYSDYLVSTSAGQHNLIYNLATNSGCMDNTIIELKSGIPPFAIISPTQNEMKIKDSTITVSGNCPTNGADQIALTNVCSDFSGLNYTVDCVNNQFSSDFYYNGISNWVVAVDKNSEASDCVNYDDLMDFKELQGIAVIEGYPDDWNFNYDYYDDFDIVINSPAFDMPALTLPLGSQSVDMSFSFVYPRPLSPNLVFDIKQYDENGTLLNGAYHTKALYEMADTDSYSVNLTATTTPLHYVVQLTDNGNLKRQFSFGVYVSDLNLIVNPDGNHYLFPRLVEKLKKKVVFNYYFAFYDGFYTLFNTSPGQINDDALDITFKSMSDNGEYNLDIPVFLGSNPAVKTFSSGLRPYITTFLWLIFAVYVLVRINHLFNNED